MDQEIREAYKEDTIGRRYYPSIVSKHTDRIKEEGGEVITMNLNKPMKVKEFKKLSDESKIKYITHLKKTYNVNIHAIYEMLGCSRSWFHQFVTKPLGLSKMFMVGKQMTFEENLKWNEFLKDTDNIENTYENLSENSVKNTENQNIVDNFKAPEPLKMEVLNANFTVSGVFDAQRFSDILKNYINEGCQCEISVSIDMTGPKTISPMQ